MFTTDLADAMLVEQLEDGNGRSIPLGESPLTFGRADQCDVVIDAQGVSRRHATVHHGISGFWLTDLASKNGTFLNGSRIGTEPRRLRNFDRVDMGGASSASRWVFLQSQATMDIPRPGR